MISAIIVANGTSSRFGEENKLLENINGDFVITLAIEKFLKVPSIKEVILVSNDEIFNVINTDNIIKVYGGKTRPESVMAGLKKASQKYVMIHDGARPFVSSSLINKLSKELEKHQVVVPILNITSSLKMYDNNKIKTVNRESFFQTQTPQCFKKDIIINAYENINTKWVDDLQAIEGIDNIDVKLIPGEISNIKITFKKDIIG
ncbi:2-C-methyl-D-erythritol 4-phosphate cytidylyltransferase [Spiroplasma litorale]|uniref:2-C-methyl-D-erythritol 4-phosphate cytidylyltransferase n=1 Tax=Spiroplasma litorale TaxID=216942 RepID=A0A0K1W0Q1_9MOLU|nr:IspD/TarI family cytidylyltransferase [Spiroplasma litorale]AKX33687.1 2-C-methyl-D-erythritol 4-phosphate cytidylyltransferase [Spiroplasma litorale]